MFRQNQMIVSLNARINARLSLYGYYVFNRAMSDTATRIAMYQRALKAAGPTPDSHRLAALSEAAAGLFALD